MKRLRVLSAIAVLGAGLAVAQWASAASERTLSFHNLHTGENVSVVYKRNGRYVQAGLDQLNYILRDWRKNETTEMDPRLFDLAWEVYQKTGSQEPINIISGYRSPSTNEMLRSNSNGVAQNSQHILGKAMDIQFPDVDLETMRNVALRMQIGGVGYYPTSGSPFVHIDVGSVRHWPRLNRTELAAVFPDGHSLHIPSDGVPLPGYDEAQQAYQQRGSEVVALFSEPSDGEQNRRIAGLFGGNDETPPAQPAAASPPPIPVASVTTLEEPPTPRAEIAGVTVSEPAMAFAPADEPERDPLDILTDPPVAAAVVAALPATAEPDDAAPTVVRRWNDPLLDITAPIINDDTMSVIARAGTLRQASAVRLSMPYVGASPEYLLKPERIVASGFNAGSGMANSAGFTGTISTVAMINLINITVADAR